MNVDYIGLGEGKGGLENGKGLGMGLVKQGVRGAGRISIESI